MGYRDASESLRAYRDRIAADLAQARQAAKDAADHARKTAVLERELKETDVLLQRLGTKRTRLPVFDHLDRLEIAAPRKAPWEHTAGGEHVRFCGQCEKNVYNVSSLPRDEAEALLAARAGDLCVRMYKRAEGTVMTADCPVGVKKRRRRRVLGATVGGGLMAAAGALTVAAAATMGMPRRGDLVETGSAAPETNSPGVDRRPGSREHGFYRTPRLPTAEPTLLMGRKEPGRS